MVMMMKTKSKMRNTKYTVHFCSSYKESYISLHRGLERWMVQWLGTPATLPEDSSWVPRTLIRQPTTACNSSSPVDLIISSGVHGDIQMKVNLKQWVKFFFLTVCVQVCTPESTCGGQRAIHRSRSPPSTRTWVPGIKLRPSALTHWVVLLPHRLFYIHSLKLTPALDWVSLSML